MQYAVYYPQSIEGGRFIVSELRSFLWFKWWRPVPDLYIEYDGLLVEEKKLKLQLAAVKEALKKEEDSLSTFRAHALASYQGYSRSLSPKKRKLKRVDTTQLQFNQFDISALENERVKKVKPNGRGPPTVSSHSAADNAPGNNSNNGSQNPQQKKKN